MVLVVDLDGVIWKGQEPIPGSAKAVERLKEAGRRVVFLTNNSAPTEQENLDKLASFGVSAGQGDVISSAQAAASLVARGERVLSCAGPGVGEALSAAGAEVVEADPRLALGLDAVVVGWHRNFDFDRLTAAMRAVNSGARLIGTNEDPTYPVADGLLPGGGALIAAVERASGATATIAGKPHRPIVDLLRARFADVECVIGDRLSTDGRLAKALGVPFALVRSGVLADGGSDLAEGGVVPTWDEADIAAVAERLLS